MSARLIPAHVATVVNYHQVRHKHGCISFDLVGGVHTHFLSNDDPNPSHLVIDLGTEAMTTDTAEALIGLWRLMLDMWRLTIDVGPCIVNGVEWDYVQ